MSSQNKINVFWSWCWTSFIPAKSWHAVSNRPITCFLWFECKKLLLKEILYMHKKIYFSHVTSYNIAIFSKTIKGLKTKIPHFYLRYHPVSVFHGYKSIPVILRGLRSRDLLVQVAYCSVFALYSLDLPQVDHFCVATVVQQETKLRDEQREGKSWAVDLFH